MLSLYKYSLLLGSLVFSISATASPASSEQLPAELAKWSPNSTVGIFFVKPGDIDADGIKRYLPSVKTAMEYKERAENNCEQNRACLPNVEFMRINPTKYRIRFFHACRNFSFVFSERFDPMWKSYIVKTSDGFEEEYLRNDKREGFHMSNSTPVENASYGTMENKHLPKGQAWDTWLSGEAGFEFQKDADFAQSRDKKTLESSRWKYIPGFNDGSAKWPDFFHWEANAFANSWFFDLQGVQSLPRTLNNQLGYYIQNSDGSINFEILIEYWPQRIFYLAYAISAFSIFLCLAAIVYIKFQKSIQT